jgi:glutathione peroxidase-family protein
MSIYDAPIHSLQGKPLDLHRFEDKALLVVNEVRFRPTSTANP